MLQTETSEAWLQKMNIHTRFFLIQVLYDFPD